MPWFLQKVFTQTNLRDRLFEMLSVQGNNMLRCSKKRFEVKRVVCRRYRRGEVSIIDFGRSKHYNAFIVFHAAWSDLEKLNGKFQNFLRLFIDPEVLISYDLSCLGRILCEMERV